MKKNKSLNNFFKLIKPYKALILFIFVIISFLELIKLIGPYILKLIVDKLLDFSLEKINYFVFLISLFFLSLVLKTIFEYFTNRNIFKVLLNIEYKLPLSCHKKLLDLDLFFHQKEGAGNKLTKVDRGVFKFTELLGTIFWEFLPISLQFIVTTSILLFIDYRLFLILLIFSFLILYINIKVNSKVYPTRKSRYKKYEEASGKMAQSIININTVKSFSQEKRELNEYGDIKKDILNKEKKEWWYILKFASIREILLAVGRAIFLFFGVYLVYSNQITIGTLVFVITISEMVFNALSRAYRFYDRFAEGIEAVNRLSDLLNTKSNIENKGKLKLKNIEGKVTFKDVNFAYENNNNVLNNLNLNFKPKALNALVGPSGGGKTTIIKLIFRHFDINSGKILLDNNNIVDLDLYNLRSFLSIVPQEVDIFDTTVFNNIAYANLKAKKDEVERAAKIANAHDFIDKLDYKYETIVGERGVKLSGGQRQRIGIARAILANPKILIFDEATSNLDTESESLIQDSIFKIAKDKTLIVIAHRLSTIKRADKIFVIEKGKVKESGSHHDLLNKEKGLYQKLIKLQSMGDIISTNNYNNKKK